MAEQTDNMDEEMMNIIKEIIEQHYVNYNNQ
jgi:hypothetical protein